MRGDELDAAGRVRRPATVLFLHGVLRCWQTFAPLYSGLALQRRVCGLDFPGHGRSDRWPGRYQVLDYIAAAAEFVRRHCPQPVVLYGHSLGAMVAAGVAAELGDPVRALVLEDPPLDTMSSRIRETWSQLLYGPGPFCGQLAAGRANWRASSRTSLPSIQRQAIRRGSATFATPLSFASSPLPGRCRSRRAQADCRSPVAGRIRLAAAGASAGPLLLLQADEAAGGMLVEEEVRASRRRRATSRW